MIYWIYTSFFVMLDLVIEIISGIASSINISLVFIATIEAVIIIGLIYRYRPRRYQTLSYDIGKLFFGICISLIAIAMIMGLIPIFPISQATTLVGLGLFWLGTTKLTDAILSPRSGL